MSDREKVQLIKQMIFDVRGRTNIRKDVGQAAVLLKAIETICDFGVTENE